jgi:hypothetical protein
MEQDGSLAREMQKRAEAMGKTIKLSAATTDSPAAQQADPAPPPPQEDISAILRSANVARKRRAQK